MDTQPTQPDALETNEASRTDGRPEQSSRSAPRSPDVPASPAGPASLASGATGDEASATASTWASEAPENTPPGERSPEQIEAAVIEALRTCFDPEIPVNIYDLGLIYSVQVEPTGAVAIRMTLTSPMCPVAGSLPPEVEAKVRGVAGVTESKGDLVWDPPWGPNMMSEAAKLQLNI